jgi:Fe-S cluster assembly protein SufD
MPAIQETAIQRFLTQFASVPVGPTWLQAKREEAKAHLEAVGFPTTKDEEWKYTDVSPALEVESSPIVNTALNGRASQIAAQIPFEALTGHRLVFVDGHYQSELSRIEALPEGVILENLAASLARNCEILTEHFGRHIKTEGEAFNALNTMFAVDGTFLRVPANIVVEAPIHLVFISTNDSSITHPRNVFLIGNFAQATVIESFVSGAGHEHFTNAVTEVSTGNGAQFNHVKVNLESDDSYHIGTIQIQSARDVVAKSYNLNFGGKIVRNNSNAVLGDENGEVTLNGLVLGRGHQLVDNHTVMDHALPHCASHEMYVHVLDDHSTGVFNGKIFVRLDAQKTDAKQSNRTLLLSPDATINAKPQLEIFADDVKCTHGATIGQLDENAMFYLRARGIPEREAYIILIRAFAEEVFSGIENEALLEALEKEVEARLS